MLTSWWRCCCSWPSVASGDARQVSWVPPRPANRPAHQATSSATPTGRGQRSPSGPPPTQCAMKQSLFKPKSIFMDSRHLDTGAGKDAMFPARRRSRASRAGPSDGFAEKNGTHWDPIWRRGRGYGCAICTPVGVTPPRRVRCTHWGHQLMTSTVTSLKCILLRLLFFLLY